MASNEALVFLQSELQRWLEEGLLDRATCERLQLRYAFATPAAVAPLVVAPAAPAPPRIVELPLVPQPQAPLPGARASLPAELPPVAEAPRVDHRPAIDPVADAERQAVAMVAADPEPEPELEAALEAEARFHEQLEAQVSAERQSEQAQLRAAARAPVEERSASLAQATAAAATDLVAAVAGGPAPQPTAEEAVLERDSLWAKSVRPFLYQNALWLAGGLLVLFGSLYFLRLIWDDLSSLLHHTVIAGALHVYAAAFFGAGYTLCRKRQAHGVGRILFGFAAGVLPLGSVAAGELAALLAQGGGPGAALAAGALLAALAVQAVLLAVIAGLFERSSIGPLVQTQLALALLTASVAPAAALLGGGPLLLLALPIAFVTLARGLWRLCREPVHLRQTILFCGGMMLWSFVVLVARLHVAAPIALTHHATLIAALAALLVTLDHRLRRRDGHAPRLTPLGLALHGALLAALGLAIAGLVRLGYFDLWARLTVLGTSTIAVVILAQGAVRHGRSALTHLAAGAGLLTYFFLPAPFAGLLLLAQRWINTALGYAHEPLPVAYYGLTFVPYLVVLGALAVRLRERRRDLSRDLQHFLIGIGALLVVLASLTRSGDLRPMLWTWPIYAVGAFVGAWLFGRARLAYAGHAVTAAFLGVLGLWTQRRGFELAPGVLLGGYALGLALAAVRWRDRAHLGHASAGACSLALVALVVSPSTAAVTCVGLLLSTACLGVLAGRTSSRLAAHLAALGGLATVIAACCAIHGYSTLAFFGGGAVNVLPIYLALYGAAGVLIAHLLRHADDLVSRRTLVAQPATVTAALALTLALLVCVLVHPLGWTLPIAALLVHLAIVTRTWITLSLAALAVAVAGGGVSAELVPRSGPMTLSVLASAYMLLAPAIPAGWPRAERRALALTLCGYIVVGAGLIGGLSLVHEASDPRWWNVLLAAQATLFCLALTITQRRRDGTGIVAVGALAIASTSAAALLLYAAVEPTNHSAWIHGALFAGLALLWAAASRRLPEPHLQSAARWIGALLLLLPLGCQAIHLGLALLQCGLSGAWFTGLTSLQANGAAMLCACAGLIAAHRVATLHGGTFARQLLIAAAVGVPLLLFRLVWPGAHLSAALALCAVVLAALGSSERPVPIAWPLILAAAAMIASHGHSARPDLLLGCVGLTLALAIRWRRSPTLTLVCAAGIALSVTAQVLVLWIAAVLSTGRYPAVSVLALMAPMAMLVGLLVDALARRVASMAAEGARASAPLLRGIGRADLVTAALLAALSMLGCQPQPPHFVVALAALTLAALAALLTWLGRRDSREWLVHGALLALTGCVLVLRSEGLPAANAWLDAALVLLGAQAALWGAAGRTQVLARPLQTAALLWPLFVAVPLAQLGPSSGAIVTFLVSLHYLAAARSLGSRHLLAVALAFGNAALFISWSALQWSDLLLYALPLAGTLLGLIHVYGAELGRTGCRALRSMVLVAIYSLSVGQALVAVTPLQALVVVPSLCVAGIVAGVLLRVRAYVLMGVGFLAADLVGNMVRYGLASRPLGALFLTLLGLVLVAAMVIFSLERERILRRYSVILSELHTWE